ncbi:MAG: YhdP family protein [Chromatocurvus sp.]
MNRASDHVSGGSAFHRLAGILWRLLVAALLLLAGYVLAVRLLVGSVSVWKDDLLAAVNTRLPFTLQAAEIEGSLQGFSPQIVLRDLAIHFDAPEQAPVMLTSGHLRLNPLNSLLTLTPQISDLRLEGLNLELARSPDGVLRLVGFEAGAGLLRDWLTDFIARVDALHIYQSRLLLRDAAGDLLSAAGVQLDLRRSGSSRMLDARLFVPGNDIRVQANGVGDPLTGASWRGDVYLHLEGDTFERVLAWAPTDTLPITVSGGGSVEAWLSRAGGRSDIALRVRTEDLVIAEADGGWALPLQTLAMNASLSQVIGGWRLHASQLSVAHDGQRWEMPRARFQLLGDSLSARIAGMRLDGIEKLFAAAPATPDALASALADLRPRGFLTAADLTLDDIRAPGNSWSFAARIDETAVDSWRGAPGVEGLDALVELTPAGGRILLDGRKTALTFPAFYRQPLAYDELYGELALVWDEEAVNVSSNLITARGAEGTAKAVFSLDFPRHDDVVGPAMNLLVGLRDSEPRHRAKYLPATLPGGVTRWLQDSLSGGRIEQGGFVWRGSLRRRNFEHMTVQMFFELQDTDIRFDPQWPALRDFSGPVLIDDRRVSIWADSGSVGDLQLHYLSAELAGTAPGVSEMAVAVRVAGDAGAGLGIVRNSPLNDLTAGALGNWQASGDVRADLRLHIPVSNLAAGPQIDLEATLDGVALDIRPGRLPLRDMQGILRYQTGRGFAGSDVAGSLWGEALTARHGDSADAATDTQIDLEATVAAPALLDWLGDDPGMIRGQTSVSGVLRIARGRAPVLALNSALEGVALDLPAPWGKMPADTRDLALQLRLGAVDAGIDLSLDNTLSMALQLEGGRVVGGNLALESDWLQAVYSPTASPQVLVDWLDLDGLRTALSAGGDDDAAQDALAVPEVSLDARGGGVYRFLTGIPATEVQVLDLRREGSPGGHMAFRLESDGSALYARAIRGDIFGLRSESGSAGGSAGGTEMRWSGTGDGGFATALDIDLSFDNLGAVFEGLGFAPALESRSGAAVGSLRWTGTPAGLRFENLQGTLQVQARDGRLLQSPGGASGALKVVTLLNLAELLKGLSLSSMFESGVPFERASGDLVFNRGQLRIPSLTLDGSASAFRFSGTTNLSAVDGELVVTLPVANNLPWVVALAAGLPVAAGVFVVSKVFEKQVERMSSGVYSVSGPVDSPQVRLKRIFDNRSEALPEPIEDDRVTDIEPITEPDASAQSDEPLPEDSDSSRR